MSIRLLCDFLQFAYRVLKVDTLWRILFVNLIKGQKDQKPWQDFLLFRFSQA